MRVSTLATTLFALTAAASSAQLRRRAPDVKQKWGHECIKQGDTCEPHDGNHDGKFDLAFCSYIH
ncbi:hypothetical protein AC579_7767 [Pseudocercospora musae]|uniref:Uncharacterized protein n=1 Tax=Pseudocercospora musae TaxID=113226 RepID=A0A139IJU1_9PEZI|nr:hypothetical protein AC579_7767 [Pseudocercospora musae]